MLCRQIRKQAIESFKIIQICTLDHHDHMIQRKYIDQFYDSQYYLEQDSTHHGVVKTPYLRFSRAY
jgi:hypothetical protein